MSGQGEPGRRGGILAETNYWIGFICRLAQRDLHVQRRPVKMTDRKELTPISTLVSR
jgi:hypothetical protein